MNMQTHTEHLSNLGCCLHNKYGKRTVETRQLTQRQGSTKLIRECVVVNGRESESGTPPGSSCKEECAPTVNLPKLSKDEGSWEGDPNTPWSLSIHLRWQKETPPLAKWWKNLNRQITNTLFMSHDKSEFRGASWKSYCLCQAKFLVLLQSFEPLSPSFDVEPGETEESDGSVRKSSSGIKSSERCGAGPCKVFWKLLLKQILSQKNNPLLLEQRLSKLPWGVQGLDI